MNLPIEWGDVATWVQAVGGMAQVGHVVWSEHLRRARDFAGKLQHETRLDDQKLARALADDPDLVRVVFEGFEAAMRSAAEEKRWVLARVVASAFEDDARIEETDVLLRTVSAIEPYHLRMLTRMAIPRPGEGQFAGSLLEGSLSEEELASTVASDQQDLIVPILGTLSREGLVRDVAIGTWGYKPAWSVSSYGRRLLQFVDGAEELDRQNAAVTVVAGWGPNRAVIRNLGPGPAVLESLEAVCDGEVIGRLENGPTAIDAGRDVDIPFGDVPAHGGVQLNWRWRNGRNEYLQDSRLLWRPR